MSIQTFSIFQSGRKGNSVQVERSKIIVTNTKTGRLGFFKNCLNGMVIDNTAETLSCFIPSTATLVPIPRSAPLVVGAQWPSLEICKILQSLAYGQSIKPLLSRIRSVPKAAFQSTAEQRPSVQLHYETIQYKDEELFSSEMSQIILVDDVITQGRIAYACYKIIKEHHPQVPVSLFCVIRSMSFQELTNCYNPKSGAITYNEDSGKTIHQIQ